MISVEQALACVCAEAAPVATETVALPQGLGRVLAVDLSARLSHPPAPVSAMDGYAVRAADVATAPVTLTLIGVVPAGGVFAGRVETGQTVRIFTGAPLPDGADSIVIQEHVEAEGDRITIRQAVAAGASVRAAGLDFRTGTIGLTAPRRLTARDLALAAAMNLAWLPVRRRPVVAVLSTGDELVRPGETPAPGQIVDGNGTGLAALVEALGGTALSLGIARDHPDETLAAIRAGADAADVLVTTGGAAEGAHDLVRAALAELGWREAFWKVAMRPGKPVFFGHLGRAHVLGLPGNPVSALVCALVFLHPLLCALLGLPDESAALQDSARLTLPMPATAGRRDFVRARFGHDETGRPTATPFAVQDSAMLSRLAWADGLIVRPPDAPVAAPGDLVTVRRFPGPWV